MKAGSFEDLVSLYFDDELDSEGVAELNRLLETRPDLASRFVSLGRVHGGMRELFATVGSSARTPIRRRRFLLFATPTFAAAAFLVLVYVLSRPSARLEESHGAVTFDGSSLETPAGGSATLALPDGTRLHAGAETSLRLVSGGVTLHHGTVAGDVSRQSSLQVTTHQAELLILGSRLFISVELESTLCRVEEGLVRMTSRDTRKTVEVGAGFYAVTTPLAPLKAEPVSKPERARRSPEVRILAPTRWPKSYAVASFHAGSLLYRDRVWEITDIPPEVDGALGIVTLAEDRKSQADRLLVFEIDQEADVWVGIDGRAAQIHKKLPGWLSSWESTGLRIYSKTATTDCSLDLPIRWTS